MTQPVNIGEALRHWRMMYAAGELKLRTQEDEAMGRYASDTGGSDFKQASEGTHIARCYSIIDLGTQHGEYQGSPTVRNQIIVRWELPLETEVFDGETKPLIVSKFYTNSLSEKANLRKDLEMWRARAFTAAELDRFDLVNIVGKPCMVTIVHNEKGKAKVAGVSALPKGTNCPPQVNPTMVFWMDEFDQAKFDSLPEGFQKIIQQSDEWEQIKNGGGKKLAPQTEVEDDIPF